MDAADLEQRIGDLYGLALEEFVPARDALAKALRADKQREAAKEVAGLRRPSVAAWGVNQVVRTQGAAVRDLWAAGDELVEAQRAVVAGESDRSRLRDAMRRRRDALAPIAEALRGLLSGRGKGLAETTVQEAVETLTAASLDAEVREEVERGRLRETIVLTGFEGTPVPDAAPEPKPEPKAKAKSKPKPKGPSAAERKRREAEEREARRRQEELEAAQRALEAATRERETALAALREAEEAEASAREAVERLSARG